MLQIMRYNIYTNRLFCGKQMDEDNLHPLIIAAASNDISQVRHYLDSHVGPDCISEGITPLWMAAQEGHFEVAELLVNAGADVNFKHPCGQSVLWTAAEKGYTKIVSLLLSKGALANELAHQVPPLWVAIQNSHFQTVQEFLKFGCNVDWTRSDGTTPLMLAVYKEDWDCVDALLLAGAKVDKANKVGKTALSFAVHDKLITKRLIKAGAQADLSYSSIVKQFTAYLNSIRTIFPDKYRFIDIEGIKESIEPGLCYGFSMLLVALPESSWPGLYSDLKRISEWDRSVETLRANKELQNLFEELLGTLLWLHRQHNLLPNGERETGSSLINLITENKKELLFNFGFLLKAKEIEDILQLILMPGKKVQISFCSASLSHSILLTQNLSNEYVICDDNSGIGPIVLNSVEQVVETLYLIFGESVTDSLGLGFEVYDDVSSPDKERYREYKARVLNSLLEERLKDDEINLSTLSFINSLSCAVYNNDEDTVVRLLENGAKFNKSAFYALQPTYVASHLGNVRILEQLVHFLKDLSLDGDSDEGFPLFIASAFGRTPAVRFLIQGGVTVNRRDKQGATPLVVAAQNGHLESVIELVEHGGADVNFLMSNGQSPVFKACIEGHADIVTYLVQHGADVSQIKDHECYLRIKPLIIEASSSSFPSEISLSQSPKGGDTVGISTARFGLWAEKKIARETLLETDLKPTP